MSWQRFVVLWCLLSVIVGPIVGRILKARRLELEAADEYASLAKWDVPDVRHCERVSWGPGYQRTQDQDPRGKN